MNQSDKKNLEFIQNAGVSYFLQDSPRNWFENTKNNPKKDFEFVLKWWKNGQNSGFTTVQLKNKENWSKYRFTVDYPEDYEVVKRIENELKERQQFGHVGTMVAAGQRAAERQEQRAALGARRLLRRGGEGVPGVGRPVDARRGRGGGV